MSSKRTGLARRDFIRMGAAGGCMLAAGGLPGLLRANQHPHPHPGSLDHLDRNTYIHNMQVRGHLFPGQRRNEEIEMMAIGERRFLFQQATVIEVTHPLEPKVLKEEAYVGEGDIQLAFNSSLGRWILVTSADVPSTSSHPGADHGKYDDPALIEKVIQTRGLRGVRIYDATNPTDIRLLSKWSCDQLDPERELQTGSGAAHNFYSGGKYAYLDCAFDNSFINVESPIRYYSNGVQTLDLSDPTRPSFVSNWWVPGQRLGEEEAYHQWRGYGDHKSFTCKNGPFYVPRKVEDGGRYAYSTWGSFGFFIHDVSDPAKPQLLGRFVPPYLPGGIQMYATDVSRLERGFVVANPEILNPDCNQPWHDAYVIDIRDPKQLREIGILPVPQPPPEAPYRDFCDKRGRFGSRTPQNQKAPGKPDPNFSCYAYFNAGAQCFDLSDPSRPRNSAYFIPPQGGDLEVWNSYNRTVDIIFVEWDRKLIWVGSDTGLYLVSTPDLGKPVLGPMEVEEWSLPGLNRGHS
jgi:hypothetical protein